MPCIHYPKRSETWAQCLSQRKGPRELITHARCLWETVPPTPSLSRAPRLRAEEEKSAFLVGPRVGSLSPRARPPVEAPQSHAQRVVRSLAPAPGCGRRSPSRPAAGWCISSPGWAIWCWSSESGSFSWSSCLSAHSSRRRTCTAARGSEREARGRGGARPRGHTHTALDTRARLSPRTAATTGACSHTCRAARARQAGPSLSTVPSLRSLASASPAPFPASAPFERSCTSLRSGSLAEDARSPWPQAGALSTHSHAWGAAAGGGGERDGAGGRDAPAVACSTAAAAASASGWARQPPPSPAAIALAPERARPCPGSPTRPTAPSSAWPQRLGGRQGGVEGDPDLHPQGGFHLGRGLLDLRNTESSLRPLPGYNSNKASRHSRWYSWGFL